MNSVYNLLPCFPNINSYITFASTPRSFKGSHPFRFSHQSTVSISHFPLHATCPAHLTLLDIITRMLFGIVYKLWSSSFSSLPSLSTVTNYLYFFLMIKENLIWPEEVIAPNLQVDDDVNFSDVSSIYTVWPALLMKRLATGCTPEFDSRKGHRPLSSPQRLDRFWNPHSVMSKIDFFFFPASSVRSLKLTL
jgi:hypothetical protein